MKYQALFSSKDKSKILKGRLLQFLFGALRVKIPYDSKQGRLRSDYVDQKADLSHPHSFAQAIRHLFTYS